MGTHNSAMRRGELVGLILAAISTVTNCQSRGTLLVERPRRSADLDKGPERECSPGESCMDKLSQDGSPWRAANDYNFNCTEDYGSDPASYCAAYGGDVDAYNLTGNKACCVCGGGDCDVFPAPTPYNPIPTPTPTPTFTFPPTLPYDPIPSPTPTPTDYYSVDESSGISKGALIGICIGIFIFVKCCFWGFWYHRRQRCRRDCASRDECQNTYTAFSERPVESGATQPQFPHYTAPQEWYYEDSTEARHGPVTLEGLRSMGLPDDTRCWKDGLSNWVALSSADMPPPPRQ